MSEIQRRDAHVDGDVGADPDVDRDAKIEQLLLVGLDHYFAARYEHAINVWTRALFFDRNHPRARAYIERARSALAERQRQSEELLHTGVAAFHRGEDAEARRLLQEAIDGGAPPDEALTVLQRLNRSVPIEEPGSPDGSPAQARSRRGMRPLAGDRLAGTAGSRVGLTVFALVLVVLAVGAYATWVSQDWPVLAPLLSGTEPASRAAGAPVPQNLALPLPLRGEMALSRARTLAAGGRLHDALAALDGVRPTDRQKEEADRLRADIQRQLLALTVMPSAPVTPERDKPERRLP
jgi:tetratricopeptide (TPR) repeat protein